MPVYKSILQSATNVTPHLAESVDDFAKCKVNDVIYDEKTQKLIFYGKVDSSSSPKKYDVELHFFKVDKFENLSEDEIQEGYKPKPNLQDHEIKLRCNCQNYRFRFDKANRLNKVGAGRGFGAYRRKTDRKPYNPHNYAGLCHHLVQFVEYLQSQGFIF